MQAPQVFHKSKDTAALFDSVLVIYSRRTASLTLFHLGAQPPADPCGVHLPWEACAMPDSPADAPIPDPCIAAQKAQHKFCSKENQQVRQTSAEHRTINTTDAPHEDSRGGTNLTRSIPAAKTADFYTTQNPNDTRGEGTSGPEITATTTFAEAGKARSRMWKYSDIESVEPELERASLHWNTCMVSSESGRELPSSSSCWSAMATDSLRNR